MRCEYCGKSGVTLCTKDGFFCNVNHYMMFVKNRYKPLKKKWKKGGRKNVKINKKVSR